jgi:hypothetical protein
MKPPRHLDVRVEKLEARRRPPPPPSALQWLTAAELDAFEQCISAGDEKGAEALLAATERRAAAGDSERTRAGDAFRDEERRVYWDELLPAALAALHEKGTAIDYDALHDQARRLAAEWPAGRPVVGGE